MKSSSRENIAFQAYCLLLDVLSGGDQVSPPEEDSEGRPYLSEPNQGENRQLQELLSGIQHELREAADRLNVVTRTEDPQPLKTLKNAIYQARMRVKEAEKLTRSVVVFLDVSRIIS